MVKAKPHILETVYDLQLVSCLQLKQASEDSVQHLSYGQLCPCLYPESITESLYYGQILNQDYPGMVAWVKVRIWGQVCCLIVVFFPQFVKIY